MRTLASRGVRTYIHCSMIETLQLIPLHCRRVIRQG